MARILLVEDEGVVALSIQQKLESFGYSITSVAVTGPEAIEQANLHRPDLVLMDIKLRGDMDGIETAEEISKTLGTPIIFMTAYGNESILNRAKKTEPYGYIMKPFQEREVRIAIELALFRHKSELALKSSEERYRRLMETAGDAIVVVDAETLEIVDLNEMSTTLLGLEKNTILNDDSPLRAGDIAGLFTSAAQQGRPLSRKDIEIRPQGRAKVFWMDANLNTLEAGGRKLIQGIFRNISERKEAENALYESEKKYRLMFEQNPMPMFILEIESLKFLAANATASEHYGYSEEELISMNIMDLSGEEDRDVIRGFFSSLTSGASASHKKIVRQRTRNSREIFVDLNAYVIDYEGALAWIVLANDITDEKKAKDLLEQRQNALQAVYKMATTLGGSLELICNNISITLARLMGLEMVSVDMADGETLNQIAGTHASMPACGTDDKTRPCPHQIFKGRPCLYLIKHQGTVACLPILDAGNKLIGRIKTLLPPGRTLGPEEIQLIEIFSRYIAIENERAQLERKLISAQRMEVIGKLAGGVAHEVRNPLNAIMAITDALDKDIGGNEEYKEFIGHMRSQVERLSGLMTDLLDLGKPVKHLDFKHENLCHIMGQLITLWGQTHRGHTHRLEFKCPLGLENTIVYGDARRLQQVFMNLVDNASEHSPANSVISLSIDRRGPGRVIIKVSDQGSGIQEDLIPRMFEPFFSTRRGGTGLGLSIVKHFIEVHNGDIRVYNNTAGPGLTAEINLPAEFKQEGAS